MGMSYIVTKSKIIHNVLVPLLGLHEVKSPKVISPPNISSEPTFGPFLPFEYHRLSRKESEKSLVQLNEWRTPHSGEQIGTLYRRKASRKKADLAASSEIPTRVLGVSHST